jgi:hypothetical protein
MIKRKNTITTLNKKAEIRLVNKFIIKSGFRIGDKIVVSYFENKIVIEKEQSISVKEENNQHKLFL